MVERFNCSLLQLLRAYVEKEHEWERYLPLVLFAYRTVTHTSTGVSPFTLMFRRQPNRFCNFSHPHLFDPGTYQAQLQAKLAQLHDLVETNSPKLATPKRPHSSGKKTVTGVQVITASQAQSIGCIGGRPFSSCP